MSSVVTLREYLDELLLERDVSRWHEAALKARVDRYGDWLGHPGTLEDLVAGSVNRWVKSLQDGGQFAAKTIAAHLDAIKFVWKAAFDRGDVEMPPYRLRSVRVPRRVVRAWTQDEVRALLAATSCLRGTVPGTEIRKVDYFRALIYVMYATGLRRCDVQNHARRSDVSPDGVLSVVQKKTGYPVSRRLTEQAILSIRILPAVHEYLLPWPGDTRRFYESFGHCVRKAGIPRGGPHKLRATAGSVYEREHPGQGGQFLGHRDVAMFDKHYNDRSISQQVPPPPPEL